MIEKTDNMLRQIFNGTSVTLALAVGDACASGGLLDRIVRKSEKSKE